jgi:hypothetical protein
VLEDSLNIYDVYISRLGGLTSYTTPKAIPKFGEMMENHALAAAMGGKSANVTYHLRTS